MVKVLGSAGVRPIAFATLGAVLLGAGFASPASTAETPPARADGKPATSSSRFLRDLAPILTQRCLGCHGERANLGGWRAHTFSQFMRPGASGRPAVIPGKPDQSQLVRLLTESNPARRMPKQDRPLSAAEISLFRSWINSGAKFDGAAPDAGYAELSGPRTHPASPVRYAAAAPVLALTVRGDGDQMEIVVGGYHELTAWSPAGRLLRRVGGLPQRIQAVVPSPDGARLLVAGGTPGEYGEVTLVDPAGRQPHRVLDFSSDLFLSAAFSSDGQLAVAGATDGSVRLFDLTTGKRRWVTRVHSDWATSVSVSPDRRFVASASKDMTVKVHDLDDGTLFTTYNGHNRQLGTFKGQDPVYAVQFLNAPGLEGGPWALSAGGGRWIQQWNPVLARDEAGTAGDMEERFAKQSHARYLEHGFGKAVYALTSAGNQLFAAAAEGGVKQFALDQRREVAFYPTNGEWIFAVALNLPATRLVAGSADGAIRVWDTTTRKEIGRFTAAPGVATSPPAGDRSAR